MAGTEEEFLDLVSGDAYVDIDRLRKLAVFGVPADEVRGVVWRHLLLVSKPTDDSSGDDGGEEDFKIEAETLKRVRGEIKRYCASRHARRFAEKTGLMERILTKYLARNYHVEYDPALVHLLGPFVYCMPEEAWIADCFQILMSRLEPTMAAEERKKQISHFIMLLRVRLPELHNHCEEEELDTREWASRWLAHLLSQELPLPCLLRLWDTYFASAEGFALHPYVCLAVLEQCAEDLLELDYPEMKGFLQHLPTLDMDQVIAQAYNIKEEVEYAKGAW